MRFRVIVSQKYSVLENNIVKLDDLVKFKDIDAYSNRSKTEAIHSYL